MAAPVLSVLVPAYRYAEGVARILASLPLDDRLEVIVSDDSPDDEVQAAVQHSAWAARPNFHCVHNRPALGPGANWNSLLDRATGEHAWLLHHDEFPLDASAVTRLLDALQAAPADDVIVLDCLLVGPGGRNRRHLPQFVRRLVLRRWPAYLARRNVIGPASALVVRRTLYPRFDPQLRWLIDVDAYMALLRGHPRIAFARDLAVASVHARPQSITSSLRGQLAAVARAEAATLAARRPDCRVLSRLASPSAGARLIWLLEGAAWALMRVATRAAAACLPPPVPRAQMQRALQRAGGAHEEAR